VVKPPPPPPEISLPPLPSLKPQEPRNQVEDMELSEEEEEEEESEVTPIETGIKDSDAGSGDLTDALSSFYSDLATIDGASQETTPMPSPPRAASPGPTTADPIPGPVSSPVPNVIRESSPALSDERSNSPMSFGETIDERRKRKVNLFEKLNFVKWQNLF
jgi:hypothetical protein